LDHPQHVNDAETQVVDRPVAEMREERSQRTPGRRVQLAQVLAFVAVLAGFVGALGPAQPIRTTYSWPPRTLPRGNPSRLWYTPLLLAHRIPESLSARLPCRLPPPLPGADRPTTVLATARYSDRTEGLQVTSSGRTL